MAESQMRANWWGAPEDECRITITSGAMACRFCAVSTSVSPLTTLLVPAEMLMASALSRLAAISNEVRVRVEASKNRLMTVLPRNVGTFLMGRVEISRKDSAVSKISSICSTERSWMPSRCLTFRGTTPPWEWERRDGGQARTNPGRLDFLDEQDAFFLVDFGELHFDDLVVRRLHRLSNIVGLDWKLTMSAVNQNTELNEPRSPVVQQRIHRRANRPSRVQHVVHKHDGQIHYWKVNLGTLNHRLGRNRGKIVAI